MTTASRSMGQNPPKGLSVTAIAPSCIGFIPRGANAANPAAKGKDIARHNAMITTTTDAMKETAKIFRKSWSRVAILYLVRNGGLAHGAHARHLAAKLINIEPFLVREIKET